VIGLRPALWTIGAIAVVFLALETELIASSDFATDRGLWIALNFVIGGGFVGAGLFAWYRRPDNRVGSLMVATGFAWFISNFAFSDNALPFTLGILLSNLYVATAIQLVLAFPTGRLATAFDRRLVWATYACVTVGFLPPLMTTDVASSFGGKCDCPENLLLIESHPSFANAWFDGLSVVGIALLLGVLGRLVGRWRAAGPPLRRVITPVAAAGGALMLMLSGVLLLDLLGASHDLIGDGYYATLIPFGLVPYLFLGSLAQARMLRGGAVGQLVARIGGPLGAGDLRDALARALNDPSLELAYWLPESEQYVDAEGKRVELPEQGSRRAVSDVTHDGRRVAALIHDRLLLDEPELIDAVGAAAALALEKERLEAELRAKIGELRDSRERLLEVGLSERRRLERDLHDGAQQRLVSLALDLRLAQTAVREDPDRAEGLLEGAAGELEHALEELRELARGLHPAVLSDRGLDSAVEALASRAPLPVTVAERVGERLPEAIELAAYFVVAEALTNVVKYADASEAVVRLERENGRVRVEVADDGVGGADPSRGTGLRGLEERLAVVGGRLEVRSRRGEGTMVTARIPCE
jgi:signal transduction histidine kinase